MSVGAELARARHFRGLSIRDISNRTKVSEQTLSAIEDNQIGDIPTVEVRDVLQAYAAEVDLDAEDVIYRYFAQFEAPPRIDVLRASRWSIDEFPSEETIPLEIEQPDIVQPRDRRHGRDVPAPPASANRGLDHSNVSPALIERFGSGAKHRRRYGATAIVALIAATAGFFLAEYSHRWWPAPRTPDVASIQRNAPQPSNAGQNAGSERRDEADADVVALGPSAGQASEPSDVPEATREPNATANSAESPAASPQQNRAPETTDVRPPASENSVAQSAVQNLSGWWSVTNRVESTAYRPYENLNLGYRLKLTQKGDHISGTGRKWMENGRPLPRARRTVIAVSGTVDQRQLMLSFTEYGTRRTSVGNFAFDISDSEVLQGSFSSDVAQSRGSSRAARMQTRE